jgi:hypothetical protein
MSQVRKPRKPVNSSDNGQPVNPAPESQEEQDARHLKEAVDNPGTVEIPEQTIRTGPPDILEVPAASIDPPADEHGEPLPQNPALLTAAIERPGPQTWVRVYPEPEHRLQTVLLAYKKKRNDSPDFHFVVPELQGMVRKHLRQVNVYLVADVAGEGEAFLWIILDSPFSPYHSGMARVLATGNDFINSHVFTFAPVEGKRGVCDIEHRLIKPTDVEPVLPSRPIGVLLYEALKADRRITDTSHPVYVSLTAGRKLA